MVDSPTFGAATALAGATLNSPVSATDGGASEALLASGMPLPKTVAPKSGSRPSSSLSRASYTAAWPPDPPPVDRRGSLSPSKRRRDSDVADSATSSHASVGSNDSASTAAASASSSSRPNEDDAAAAAADDLAREAAAVESGPGGSPLKRARSKSSLEASVSRRSDPPPTVTLVDMFSPGMLRVPVFRIPALLTLPDGLVLTFAEARPHLHDSGVIDLVMRRSSDNGRTWSQARVAVEGSMIGAARSATVGNPTAVYDRHTRKIWLLLCSNHKDDVEWQIHAREGKDKVGRRVWITSSDDLGLSWAKPKEITSAVKLSSWTW